MEIRVQITGLVSCEEIETLEGLCSSLMEQIRQIRNDFDGIEKGDSVLISSSENQLRDLAAGYNQQIPKIAHASVFVAQAEVAPGPRLKDSYRILKGSFIRPKGGELNSCPAKALEIRNDLFARGIVNPTTGEVLEEIVIDQKRSTVVGIIRAHSASGPALIPF